MMKNTINSLKRLNQFISICEYSKVSFYYIATVNDLPQLYLIAAIPKMVSWMHSPINFPAFTNIIQNEVKVDVVFVSPKKMCSGMSGVDSSADDFDYDAYFKTTPDYKLTRWIIGDKEMISVYERKLTIDEIIKDLD